MSDVLLQNRAITVLYFAALADQVQCSQEYLALPASANSVGSLRQWLSARGERWQALTSERILCAVNQEVVSLTHPVAVGDEVAFFPPVTGG